jgi:hypothetical protein
MPADLMLAPQDAVLMAQQLIDTGRPFHAHEVLEAAWKSAPAGQRAVWKGLAQIAVGLTHARRGNSRGAVALLRRGAEAIGPGPASAAAGLPGSLDLAGTRRAASDLADRIDARGMSVITEEDLRLRLLAH